MKPPVHFGYEHADVNGARLVCHGAAGTGPGLLDEICLIPDVTCDECMARLALTVATPGERCPYCRLPWGEEHNLDAPMVGCPIVTDDLNDTEREP